MKYDEIKKLVAELINKPDYKSTDLNKFVTKLGIPVKKRMEAFRLIRQMEAEGLLSISKSNKVQRPKKQPILTANMRSLTKTGGFATLEDKSGDIFIQKSNLKGALPSDVVTVRILNRSGRLPEGEVVGITQRNFNEFTGTFHRQGRHAYIIPDSGIKEKINVTAAESKDCNENDKVLARLKKMTGKGRGMTAHIVTSYGSSQSAAACCNAVLGFYHVRKEFPQEVLREAKSLSFDIKETENRLDLRDTILFTIDSESAKDLDDAVSVEKTESGYKLGVHIADVSHYVTEGSPLDLEAFKRGTSIYYADSVIPMLPKELSNGICSLNPNEDRLAFSAFIDLDFDGKVKHYEFHKSVIRSRVKGVYEEINRIFNKTADDSLIQKYSELIPTLEAMRELAEKLSEKRKNRGAMDIETDEAKIIVGKDGIVTDIKKRERGISEKMIEEFMLCANESVAAYISGLQMPCVYRVHEEPEAKKLETLSSGLQVVGINTRKIKPGLKPADIADVAKQIADNPKRKVLSYLILRSMAKARYSPDCIGHFGLAAQYYCHFTSPIRRYPDLAVHRILGDILKIGAGEEVKKRYSTFASATSKTSSDCELAAMQVEWGCEAIYKAEYMSFRVGQEFEGMISSVKPFGFYVELDNTVEGLVRVENIPGGWYDYDESNMALTCERAGRKYELGDRVRVIVSRADVASGQIDFDLKQGL